MYYCVVKLNKLKILGITNKDNLMEEIRNKILPDSFSTKDQIDIIFKELDKIVTADDVIEL